MPPTSSFPRRTLVASVLALTVVAASCGVDPGVASIEATRTANTPAPVDDPPATTQSDDPPPTDPPADTVAPTTEPAPDLTQPPVVEPTLLGDIELADTVDIGGEKPAREYDDFVAVALSDIERWWVEQYPLVYGEPFEPLDGGVYAGYPERQTALPGCGEPTTSYEELTEFVAFYCQIGDFMVYDDGNGAENILAPLAQEFGAAVMGIVLAHEYGHAIQARNGALARPLATIITEQQADCFAGAWTGQAYRGESPLLRLGDRDVRAGLIAMLSVRDPVGIDQFVPGGHGSAFDRVGAFQEGFTEGPSRCAQLIDDPLTLVPNEFRSLDDQALGGNAPYDCEELRELGASDEVIANCTPAPEFLAGDLDDFWETALDSFDPVSVSPTDDLSTVQCTDAIRLADEIVVCPAERTVAFDEAAVVELYREFGDFTLGYFYGIAWAELAQIQLDSGLGGEDRALLSDCFTGAWVRDITPDEFGATPRQGDRDGDGLPDGITSSPGDLDEAIQMAIIEGDDGAGVDAVGTAFEKIAALRLGVLGGLSACESLLG